MEIIRRNSDYALRSLAYLAKFSKNDILPLEAIAKKQKVPIVFLRKIFQKLVKAGIINSKTGPNGGFYLFKKAQQIKLKDVLEAAQGRISLSDCIFDHNLCSHSKKCRARNKLSDIQIKLNSLLNGYALSDFCKPR